MTRIILAAAVSAVTVATCLLPLSSSPVFARTTSSLPTVSAPVPTTATSHPFLTAKGAMEAAGYVEQEYFLSGRANVYDWVGSTRKVKVVAGPGKYVTRILVRRPRDPAKFSGNVEVFLLNASAGIDVGAPIDNRRMIAQGDVWIGITTKALTANALKKFDPVRYASLDWSNPAPVATRCANPSIIPINMIGGQAIFDAMIKAKFVVSSPDTEDGLVWDMLGQLGLLLKSDKRNEILPGFGKPFLYMDGASQSSLDLRTWLIAFHDRYRTPDGKPVYDGYLGVVGPAIMRLNQCSQDLALDDPRQKVLPPPDVPFISLSSEGEMWESKYTHQPDAVTPKGGIITYEVAGSSHTRIDIPGMPDNMSMASPADLDRVGFKEADTGISKMMPAGSRQNDMIWAPVVRGAFHNLELWVRHGVIPPQTSGIEVDSQLAIKRDANGNALGGLRTAYIQAPLDTHTGSLADGGFAGIIGARKPLPPETIKALYPDKTAYVLKFSAAVDASLAGRWILPEDAAAMKKAAEATMIP